MHLHRSFGSEIDHFRMKAFHAQVECFIWRVELQIYLPKSVIWVWHDSFQCYIVSYMSILGHFWWYSLGLGQMPQVDTFHLETEMTNIPPKLLMCARYDAFESYIVSYTTRLLHVSLYNLSSGQKAAVDKPYKRIMQPHIRQNMPSYTTQCRDPPEWVISGILGDIWCSIWQNIGRALHIGFCHAQTDFP